MEIAFDEGVHESLGVVVVRTDAGLGRIAGVGIAERTKCLNVQLL